MTIHVSPEARPAPVLNAGFRPFSSYPFSLRSRPDAIKAVWLGRVNIVSQYDTATQSPPFEMRLASVVSPKDYVKPERHSALTRFNLFLRDRGAFPAWQVDRCR